MKNVLIILTLTTGLSACGAAENNCHRYGFKPGTDAYANCLQQQELQINNAQIRILTHQ